MQVNGAIIERLMRDTEFKILLHSAIQASVEKETNELTKKVDKIENKVRRLLTCVNELELNSNISIREMV